MAPILANADVQERLLPYLPSGESLPQTADEIQNTLTSPQFQQVWMSMALSVPESFSIGGSGALGTQVCMPALCCRPWVCSVRPWPQDSLALSCASSAFLQRLLRPPTKVVSTDPPSGQSQPCVCGVLEAGCLGGSPSLRFSSPLWLFQMWKHLPKPCRTMPNRTQRRATQKTRKTKRKI